MRYRRATLVALAWMTLGPAPAMADGSRPVHPVRGKAATSALSDADLALMDRTAERLYRGATVADGAAEAWKNPRTGSAGRVTVLQTFERTLRGTGITCRKVQYEATTRAQPETATRTVTWCRQPNGTWKLT